MLWVKVFHIFFVVSWFAGIFYLPRLLVNLAMVEDDATYQHLLQMANKLRRFMMPLEGGTIIFGAWLISYNPSYYFSQTWLYAKLALVLALLVYVRVCAAFLKQFEQRSNTKSHVFFRWFNEAPVFALLFICALVIVKPF